MLRATGWSVHQSNYALVTANILLRQMDFCFSLGIFLVLISSRFSWSQKGAGSYRSALSFGFQEQWVQDIFLVNNLHQYSLGLNLIHTFFSVTLPLFTHLWSGDNKALVQMEFLGISEGNEILSSRMIPKMSWNHRRNSSWATSLFRLGWGKRAETYCSDEAEKTQVRCVQH